MKSIIITTLLAAAAMAAPEFKTTTKDATPTPPICTFDPVKGDHLHSLRRADVPSAVDFTTFEVTTTAFDSGASADVSADVSASADAPAADCAKCQADWEKCLTHWGCWFYNCGPACHCQVAKNDPSCATCSGQECRA